MDNDHECDTPGCAHGDGMTFDEIVALQDLRIAKYGFTVTGVFGDVDDLPYSYTTGMNDKGLADVAMIGLPNHSAYAIIAATVEKMLAAKDDSERYLTLGEFGPKGSLQVWLGRADSLLATHAFGVVARADRDAQQMPKIMQIIIPDTSGLFPWDEGYDWFDQSVVCARPREGRA